MPDSQNCGCVELLLIRAASCRSFIMLIAQREGSRCASRDSQKSGAKARDKGSDRDESSSSIVGHGNRGSVSWKAAFVMSNLGRMSAMEERDGGLGLNH